VSIGSNSAFPLSPEIWATHPDFHGLTKREYIAAQCLAARLVNDRGLAEKDLARWAVVAADCLIAELSK
jgi:hypothetical protein